MSLDNTNEQNSNQKGFVKALGWIAIGIVFFILSGFQIANGEPSDTSSGFFFGNGRIGIGVDSVWYGVYRGTLLFDSLVIQYTLLGLSVLLVIDGIKEMLLLFRRD